ncbi:replication protein A 32 kDa subunit A isoform X1 [Zea mays]|uniref:Replication protein A C-terminal domain-containing protein n=3 Tax=Zea mays TaxID=4577 RepID=C4J9B9_MAIZE|nr:uncharacterized protein LOC100272286 isoform X1 [Zea mays]XP_023158190.1 uncharacterized protein LOC100272286 isoform X1 [Zea mays]ACR37769.1 unknown [Zea mays]|eukprot:XP_008681337.1 uncharacterized protein LOC100272286 isoform X1 [Zea mays]
MMPLSQTDFSPSQFTSSQNAAADSTTPSKMRGASSTMPLTVKQVVDAQQSGTGEKGAPFIVNGVEMANVPIILLFVLWSVDMQMFSALIHLPRFPFQIRLVGMVNAKVERTTDVTFTLDDGTGRLDFIRCTFSVGKSPCFCADVHWLSRNGMYIAVIGSLKGLQERKRATAFSIRPITDFNEVTLHFIQCVRMHIENTELKAGSPARINSSMGVSFSNGFSESSTPTSLKSSPAPVTSGSSDTDLHTQVLNFFNEPANLESEHGVHVDEVLKRFKLLPKKQITDAIDYNMDSGRLYSTIDEFHYKAT